jgi:hypothetical protein
MIDLNKEAENYAKGFELSFYDTIEEVPVEKMAIKDFIEGAKSKYVQYKILQAQIDALKPYLEWNEEFANAISEDINRIQQKIKKLENE